MALKGFESRHVGRPLAGPGVIAKAEHGNLAGKWYYSAIISRDGTVRKLGNRESYFLAKADGTYENNFGHYPNWSQTLGKYSVKGAQLTLVREDGDRKVYEMSFADGNSLTLRSPDGAGYQLERGE
jgi:hypothetical protein